MTRTGKCDTCRARKVKCDEQRPKCGACRKRDRNCTYSFGKVSAFVIEDPTQLSKHGRPKVAPVTYPLRASHESASSSTTASSSTNLSDTETALPEMLRQISGRDADDDRGAFITLAAASRDIPKGIRKAAAQQRKRLQWHLDQLRSGTAMLTSIQPVTPQMTLAARYLNMLGSRPSEEQPFSILGSWVEFIPSRIGKSPTVDLAVEYLVQSFNVYQNPSFTNQRIGLAAKANALKMLQLAIGDENTRRSYDTAIATKIHFMAEVFMGIKNLHHAIHAAGLSDILQSGPVNGVDDDHFWSFLDNTYIDDVSEALVASRTSVYDNELYINVTSPSAIPKDAPASFRASIAMMHIYIQLPRLVCLVRHASNYPEDSRTLASAVALAESLYSLVPTDFVTEVFQTSVREIDTPPSPEIADIVSNSYHFDSIQSSVLLSRFWQLQVIFSGTIQTLYQNFPNECASSLLPPLIIVQQTDVDAAVELSRCVHYAISICPSLPLVPIRVMSTIQISLGTWYRIILRLTANNRALPPDCSSEATDLIAEQLSRAQRMENFIHRKANDMHESWGVKRVNRKFLRGAAVDMAGGPIPDWLPVRVKFESEDGEMIMKLEYDIGGPLYKEVMERNGDEGWVRKTKTMSPFHPETNDWVPRKGYPNQSSGKEQSFNHGFWDESDEES